MSLAMALKIQRYESLIMAVGKWSAHNFEKQDSKWLPSEKLGSAACVLGIIEEIGELFEAVLNDNAFLVRDAIGDVLIYLADFFYRSGLPSHVLAFDVVDQRTKTIIQQCTKEDVESVHKTSLRFATADQLIVAQGHLIHTILKRHQGIRKYADDGYFFCEIGRYLREILSHLGVLLHIFADPALTKCGSYAPGIESLLGLTEGIWSSVSQRDWKTHQDHGCKGEISPALSQEKDTYRTSVGGPTAEELAASEVQPKKV